MKKFNSCMQKFIKISIFHIFIVCSYISYVIADEKCCNLVLIKPAPTMQNRYYLCDKKNCNTVNKLKNHCEKLKTEITGSFEIWYIDDYSVMQKFIKFTDPATSTYYDERAYMSSNEFIEHYIGSCSTGFFDSYPAKQAGWSS